MALQTFTAGQVLTAAQVNNLQANDYNQTVSTKTDSYTLVAADKGTRVVMNKATATTITVNTSLFNAGDTLWIHNVGAGVCTITAGTATVSTSGSLALAQNAGGTLYFTSAGVAIFFPTVASSAQGLTLLNTTSFSGVANFNLPAGTFSATYTNYKILVRFTAATTDATVLMRMRTGGSTSSTANWSFGTYGFTSGNSAYSYGNTSDTIYYLGQTEATSPDNFRHFMDITLSEPFVANYTSVIHTLAGSSTASTYTGQSGGGFHSIKTSYDSVTIGVDSGSVTGFYSVYGYNS